MAFALLAGLALGSFVNVAISRVPRGISLMRPRSHCFNCGRQLEWWENIPVASYVALKGRCRTCGTPIGWRHPAVELLTGAAAALAAGLLVRGAGEEGSNA